MMPRTAFRLMLVGSLFCTCYLAHAQRSTSLPGFSTGMVRWQKGSPAQIVSVRSSVTSLFDGGVVLNVHGLPLTLVEIGCLIKADQRDQSPSGFAMVSPLLAVDIASRQIGLIGSSFWSVEEVQRRAVALGIKKFTVTFGVVRARVSDGQEYRFNLNATQEFLREESREIDSLYRTQDPRLFQRLSERK